MSNDVESIVRGLSKAQRAAVAKHSGCDHQTAYGWARLNTAEALAARGLVGRVGGVGAFYSPATAIKWPLTVKGFRVRQHLLSEAGEEG